LAIARRLVEVMGGMPRPDNVPTNIVEAYDPRTDTWTKKADLPTAAFGVIGGYAPVVDGKIYLISEYTVTGASPSTVQEYDPLADKWTRKTDMPITRACFAVSEAKNKVYVIGGYRDFWAAIPQPTVDEYNPATDQWVKKADMPAGREEHSASTVNGIIYVIGGGKAGEFVLPTVEAYNPQTDTWTKEADMPTPRMDFSTCVVDGKIYAIGGSPAQYQGLSTVEMFDPGNLAAVSPHGKLSTTWGEVKHSK
jgi:N-acetylneuraminic acid mutarotase